MRHYRSLPTSTPVDPYVSNDHHHRHTSEVADNSNYHRSSIYFRVCKAFEDPNYAENVFVYTDETMQQLKEKICQQMFPHLQPHLFYLTLFDPKYNTWIRISESAADKLVVYCDIPPSSFLNVVTHTRVCNNQHLPEATLPMNSLTLKLCRRPMDRTDVMRIPTQRSTSLADLKRQAEAYVTNQNSDHLYRWTGDKWIKYEKETEDLSLEELDFHDLMFISFPSKTRSIAGVCGLQNLGATCFINSALQCLSNTPPLTKRILATSDHLNAPLIGAYSELIRSLWSGHSKIETPSDLLVNVRESLPRFTRYRQHDAHEFMSYFLNRIHDELTDETTVVSDLFHGKIRSSVTCSCKCPSTEINDETIISLPLPVDNDTNWYSVLFLRNNGEQKLIQLSVDHYSRTIGGLMESCIANYDPTLSSEELRAVGIYENRIYKEYSRYTLLSELYNYQLAFMELPKKTVQQRHVQLQFHEHSSFNHFCPPVYLICPAYECRYSDVIDQIDTIRKNIFSVVGSPTSPVHDLFWINRGNERRRLKPEKTRHDYLLLLESFIIEVDPEWAREYSNRCKLHLSPRKPSLPSLLDDFFREESLNGDYYCSSCRTMTQAKQKADLVRPLPPVLIIQLKRFTYDHSSNEKIDTYIEYPLTDLDLGSHVVEDRRYEGKPRELYNLVAVSIHRGSLISGHYTTYAKNYRNGKWYLFNDERYEEITNEQEIVNKDAYILIYVKQDQC